MKKIRFIGLFIAAALIMNLGIGCSKQKDIKILDAKDLSRKVTTDKPVTLTFYFPKVGFDVTDMRLVLDEIEKKLKSTVDVKLDFKWNEEHGRIGYNDLIKEKIASGEPCEAFYYAEAQPIYNPPGDSYSNLQSITESNLAMDISKLFPKYAPNLYDKYSKEELNAATVNGRLIAIPSLFPRSIISTAMVRNDLMEKYGIQSINDLNEYEAFLKTVKQKDPELIPTTLGFDKKYMFLEQNGYVSLDYRSDLVYKRGDPDMKLNYYYDVPQFKAFENMLNRWKSNGYFVNSKGVEPVSTYNGSNDFSIVISNDGDSDNLASAIGNPPIDNLVMEPSYYKEISTFWGSYKEVTNFPLFPSETSQRISPTDTAIIIPSTAKHPEETLKFLEWVQSDQENYDLLMYGILGKHYTLYGDQLKKKAGSVAMLNDYIGWSCSIAFWNIDYLRTLMENKPTAKEKYKNLVESKSKYPEHIGFLPDYTPVADKFVNYKMDQGLSEKEKSKVLSVIQHQLDEWRKNKNK
jgi:putative aldouronate transport system substrate-binding protein